MPSHGSRRRSSRHRERADRLASSAALGAAAALVSKHRDVPIERVLAPPTPHEQALVARSARGLDGHAGARAAAAARARHEAIYLAVTLFDRTQKSVARVLGISPPAVRKALHGVEDRRDHEIYDRELAACERQLMGAA
jgi:DNA-directed RNA polymerase specialized sigma24 family protein